MREALLVLKRAGCRTVYLDGSFVTGKVVPLDYDACWDATDVDPRLLDPTLLTFDAGRLFQKAKYGGEFFPAHVAADGAGCPFIDFFQIDKQTGDAKGIVAINLDRWNA
jgi:hypothetical protein